MDVSGGAILGFLFDAVAKAGLDPEALLSLDRPIAMSDMPALFIAARQVTSDPTIGLQVAVQIDFQASNRVVYLMMSSPDLGAPPPPTPTRRC